jgi:hypothetical protein
MLADRLGVDFGAIVHTLSYLPLTLRGDDHAAQRADVARLLAERRGALAAALPDIVTRSFACFGDVGRHEVMTEAVQPCVDAMIGEIVGLGLDLPANSLVSRVFSQKIGVAQRRRLNAELALLIDRLRVAFPADTALRRGSRLALIVLGRDALMGTIALSLKAHFEGHGTGLMVPPSHTGVPYIDRQAVEAVQVDGQALPKDAVVRCMLQSLEGAGDADRGRFFGAGAHLCLGRAASLDLFQHLSRYLALLPYPVSVIETVMRDCDVFAVPDQMMIEVG